ncbi:MAG TPA: GNAT family N-acetyltransferase [Polyangiaceae bacterium]|nr:GNAT family N-acetyltransferase [Polyangiaceae bacterium]
MNIIDCSYEEHATAILEILNDAITTSTALYDYQPRPLAAMAPWFETKRQGGFPVIGVLGTAGQLSGFATYGTFRNWPAYKYSVEHSLYVHPEQRGRGVGSALLTALIARAEARGVHVMVGGIDAQNHASVRFHEKFGFTHSGTIREAGFKFGRWLDLAFYQRTLATPLHPSDG